MDNYMHAPLGETGTPREPPPRMPARSNDVPHDPELRKMSERARAVSDALDRKQKTAPPQTPRELIQVFDGGNIPTTPGKVFLANPVEIDADDTEGATPNFTTDGTQVVPVIVINQAAVAGDILVAHAVAGRWVSEKTGSSQSTTICIGACSSLPVYGAIVTVLDGSNVLATCTTGTNGCCTVNITGNHTVQVTISGVVVYSATRNLSGTVTVLLGTNAALVCCGGYAIPTTLTLTDAAGSLAFIYDPSYTYPLWTGGHSVTRTSCSVTTPDDICIVAAPSTGPVRVCYQMICHSGENPTFAVQRSWSWVYEQGTFTAIWYQDPSGFDPGEFCITAPPAICGSPLTDTASFGANPSSTSPFALSGTPVPAVSNATSDPIGGTIAISQ